MNARDTGPATALNDDVVSAGLPGDSTFSPMAESAAVFVVVSEKLWDTVLDVRAPSGRESKVVYRDLFRTVMDEGILESDFSPSASVTTKKGRYSSLGWNSAPNLWRLFCLECHFQATRGRPDEHAGGFARAVWLLYETDSFVGDPLGDHESFFVALDGEIIVDRFVLSGECPGPPDYGSTALVESGIWEQTHPRSAEDDTSPHWRNQEAWWIGGLRALYARFYEETRTGRACALAPGNRRLDEIAFWVRTPKPDSALLQLPRRVEAIAERVEWIANWFKLLMIVGGAIAVGGTIRECLK